MSATAFGTTLRHHREALGFSLQDVGDRAHLSKTHIWELERGRTNNPTVECVAALATALGITPEVLFSAWLRDRRDVMEASL